MYIVYIYIYIYVYIYIYIYYVLYIYIYVCVFLLGGSITVFPLSSALAEGILYGVFLIRGLRLKNM